MCGQISSMAYPIDHEDSAVRAPSKSLPAKLKSPRIRKQVIPTSKFFQITLCACVGYLLS
ncbi:hypothetical protein PHMEG_0008332 [Phytophthora megakarya]|uniref:Uncharacterized protein n=1 Tax=Phytophthora megakarya TaxID=4795 RepID=A0A225WIZ5_9STRA|nr:hypothetical protein PHMEG_0008332 [Phytophthora megakarya]